MPWRRGPRTFCNRPEVVFNCNGVLAWVCHFQQAAFSSLAKRPGRCPVSVSTLQLLIAGCELPANLSPNAPAVKWVIFNTVTAPVMSAKFSPDTTKQIQYYFFSEANLRFWNSPRQDTMVCQRWKKTKIWWSLRWFRWWSWWSSRWSTSSSTCADAGSHRWRSFDVCVCAAPPMVMIRKLSQRNYQKII